MCPKPGMILNRTATASLALPSAVSTGTPRFQSHLSQCCASFGRSCPQYGHGSVLPGADSALVGCASVYSIFAGIVENLYASQDRRPVGASLLRFPTQPEFVKQNEKDQDRKSVV